jgi:hypothetical protein
MRSGYTTIVRVLIVVERQEPRASLARQLLGEYHVDFEWSHTASEAELRHLSEEFKPNLVFCSDGSWKFRKPRCWPST